LPRPRHKTIVWKDSPDEEMQGFYDPALWERYNWGLASRNETDLEFLRNVLPGLQSDESRRQVALALQGTILERIKKFHESMDVAALTPQGLELYLVAGDAEETAQKIVVDRADGSYEIIERGPGDGTVLRSSALNDERVGGDWQPELVSPIDWTNVMFLFADHLGLTQDEAFADNVLYWLLEEPRR
jgi:hypothetical protein